MYRSAFRNVYCLIIAPSGGGGGGKAFYLQTSSVEKIVGSEEEYFKEIINYFRYFLLEKPKVKVAIKAEEDS